MGKIDIQPLQSCRHLTETCARWNYREWGHAAGRSLGGTVAAFHAILESRDEAALVAFMNGTPAGIVLLVDSDLESHGHLKPWLASLYVRPDFRGHGVGRALVDEVELMAGQRGDPVLYLYTATPDFYRTLGWSTFEVLACEDAALEIMTKALDPQ